MKIKPFFLIFIILICGLAGCGYILAQDDYTKPTVYFTAPTANGTVVSGTYAISAYAVDNVGVAKVKFFLDNTATRLGDNITSTPYSYAWDTTAVSSGTHTLIVQAYDAAGNYAQNSITVSVQNNINADTIKPTVYFTAPTANGTVVSGTYAISAYAVDNVGVAKVKFFLDNTATRLGDNITSTPYSYAWDTTAVSSGTHTLIVQAYDAAGNYAQNSITVSVQNGTVCANDCADYGIAQCYGTSNYYQICGNYDNDSCLEWSPPVACASDTVCSGGVCVVAACASYAYSDWSACTTSGIQTRTIKQQYPSECTNTSGAVLQQTCPYSSAADGGSLSDCANDCATSDAKQCYGTSNYYQICGNYDNDSCLEWSPPVACASDTVCSGGVCVVAACASYAYSDWSACTTSGIQTRTIKQQYPSECTNTSGAVLQQTCVYNPIIACTSYTYSEWSACVGGRQTRNIISRLPAGCNDGVLVTTERQCKAIPCESYAYSNWSECLLSGKKTRKIILSLPAECAGGIEPVLEQVCVYRHGADASDNIVLNTSDASNTNDAADQIQIAKMSENAGEVDVLDKNTPVDNVAGNNTTATLASPKISCVYKYSAWSACVSGRQTRMVISKDPANCDDSGVELQQECEKNNILAARPQDAPIPAPQSMMIAAQPAEKPKAVQNFNGRTSEDWQNYYFAARICQFEEICGGEADLDKDNLSNNDEYRFGTDPKSADTDSDGWIDADEIQKGRDPLVADAEGVADAVVYETPKEAGQVAAETYKVEEIKYDPAAQKLTISGKALPNSYVTLYIYSDPIVLTIKTDTNGNWSYVLDKPEEGEHEVYVAVNDNKGKVIAKSAALPFVQTAEAANANYPAPIATQERAPAPTKSRLWEGYLIFFGTGLGGLLLAMAAIGLSRKVIKTNNEQR